MTHSAKKPTMTQALEGGRAARCADPDSPPKRLSGAQPRIAPDPPPRAGAILRAEGVADLKNFILP